MCWPCTPGRPVVGCAVACLLRRRVDEGEMPRLARGQGLGQQAGRQQEARSPVSIRLSAQLHQFGIRRRGNVDSPAPGSVQRALKCKLWSYAFARAGTTFQPVLHQTEVRAHYCRRLDRAELLSRTGTHLSRPGASHARRCPLPPPHQPGLPSRLVPWTRRISSVAGQQVSNKRSIPPV